MILALLFAGGSVVPLPGQDAGADSYSQTLTGSWGGIRSSLLAKGIDLGAVVKEDAWRTVSGTSTSGSQGLLNVDLTMSLDADRLFGWPDTTAFVHLLADAGGRPNDLVGSFGGIDNIEVPNALFRLYQAWVERSFADGRAAVLVGLLDLNAEFYVTDTSGLFMNPTYGIGTEMSVTGENGPSIFPVTGPALRIRFEASTGMYFQAGLFDGVPGDPARPRGTHIVLRSGEGGLLVGEAGWRDATSHYGVGAWKYTEKLPDAMSGRPARSQGAYFLADHSVLSGAAGDVSLFARYGFTAADVEPFRSSWSAGAVWGGWSSRPEAQLGLAISQAELGSAYRAANGPLERRETQMELTYSDRVAPGVTIQPDVQYTRHPGGVVGAADVWIAGARLTLEF